MNKEWHKNLTKKLSKTIVDFCIFVAIFVGIAGGIVAYARLVIFNETLILISILGLVFIIIKELIGDFS